MSRRSGIMLCYPFDQKRLEKWGYPVYVQPKLDGDRCIVEPSSTTRYTLYSSERNEFSSVPHINEALGALECEWWLDGELYRHGLPHEEIHSRVSRTANLHPQYDEIELHVFDFVDLAEPTVSRLNVLEILRQTLPADAPIKVVDSLLCHSFDDVMKAYDNFCAKGYEGIIVRHPMAKYEKKRSTWMMKFKPKKDDYYTIIGWEEETTIDGIPKGRIGSLICSGDDGTPFNVGSGMTEEQRIKWWNLRDVFEARALLAHVQYQHLTSGKRIPRFPVLVSIIDPVEEAQKYGA